MNKNIAPAGFSVHMDEQWTEITIVTTHEAADIISDKLHECGFQGTVFEDRDDDLEVCAIKLYYPGHGQEDALHRQVQQCLDEIRQSGVNIGKAEINVAPLNQTDWGSAWKKFFKPLRVGNRLVIKPSWEPFEARPDDIIIEIDPGMAFGTGLHASTRLCLRLLEQHIRPGDTVLDVGVGSGILSIAAARLGAAYVQGVDVDPDAVDIARENIRLNAQTFGPQESFADRVEVLVGSIDTLSMMEKFDCIVMNIRPNIILPLIPYAEAVLQTGGALIISGILEEEGAELIHEVRSFDLLVHNHLEEDGWIAYILSQMDNASYST
jgi:ribosomal protein L11 methyltransferase